MVIATPSPQQVGREFVRQYYTVLHEAPDVLHRFYSSGSTFVHGGVDKPDRPCEEPVVGQLEIDKKIKILNFKDCHTKIRQVDSQLTIGSGVVVQVTGELSNNGEPMRRFMQTFVLAPQTPKKFYVHNDIFRYQDEVYQDNSDTESEDQQINENNLINKTAELNINYYQSVEQNMQQQDEGTGQQSTSSMSSSLPILTSPQQSTEIQKTEEMHMNQNDLVSVEQPVEEQNGHMNGNVTSLATEEVVPEVETPVVEQTPVENVNNNSQKEEIQTTETKINSWAKLVQSSGANVLETNATITGSNTQVFQSSQFLNNPPQKSVTKEQNFNSNNTSNNKQSSKNQMNGTIKSNKPRNQESRGQQMQQNQQTQNQQERGAQTPREPRATENDESKNAFGRYPDGQQVFVGNLNQDLSEAELRTYFSQYGKVMDMRINTNSKQQSGRRLPNYGFVVFEEKQAVENLLNASKANSITYKNERGVEYRLNVEEKRARQGRISSGYTGGSKSNRATRSTSNGSRNGEHNNNNNQRQDRSKKNQNFSQSNTHEQTGGYERRDGGFDRRKTDIHDTNQMVDNGGRRNNLNNPRRS